MHSIERFLWTSLLAGALGGCASMSAALAPAPAAPPARPAVTEDETVPAPAKPTAKEPAPPAPKVAAPPGKEPTPAPPAPPAPAPAAPAPPAAQPPPAPPRTAAIPKEPPVLAPQASVEEENRMKSAAERRIEGTERLVQKIDPTRLVREQQDNYLTIQSFLTKAREALSARDVQRAFTLADKAYLLADELSKVPRQ